MTKFTKLLALMPLVALGAACNGLSPAAPDIPLAGDEGSAFELNAEAQAKTTDQCRDITAVNLKRVPSSGGEPIIEATYVRLSPSYAKCEAPVWSSNPRGVLTAQKNPFRVGVSSNDAVTVTATAPNGVKGQISIVGGGANLGASAAQCRDITAVNLKRVPSSGGEPIIEATYVRLSPSYAKCEAPVWSSNPRGVLTAQKNPFRVGVSSNDAVTVTATAPNGVKGQISIVGGGANLGASAAQCRDITAVNLKRVPSSGGEPIIEATYVRLSPSYAKCEAPVWSSNPRGVLTTQKNPFRVGVSSKEAVTVTATAPNGVKGSIGVQ
jgi:DNA mismatch repair protein MutH